MSRICPLFSGSTGNSTYLATRSGGILIDAGASFRGLCAALSAAGGTPEEIRIVAVTHEHIDHIKGLKTFLSKTGALLIASSVTLETLANTDRLPADVRTLALDSGTAEIGGVVVSRFPTSHDCAGSSGYVFSLPDGRRAAVCTDLGVMTEEVRSALAGCDALLLESNHDIEMLKKGPYPQQLKLRILSERGHLSNHACAAELPFFLKSGTRRFILGHLSMKNNTPMLAQKCAEAALMDLGAENGSDYRLTVAAPSGNGVTVF